MDKSIWMKVRAAVAAFFGARAKTSPNTPKAEAERQSPQVPTVSIVAFRQVKEEPHVMSVVYSIAANSDTMPFVGLAQVLQGQDHVQRVPIQPQEMTAANERSAKFEGALWQLSTTVPSELAQQVEADKQQGHQHIFVSRQGQTVGYFVLSN